MYIGSELARAVQSVQDKRMDGHVYATSNAAFVVRTVCWAHPCPLGPKRFTLPRCLVLMSTTGSTTWHIQFCGIGNTKASELPSAVTIDFSATLPEFNKPSSPNFSGGASSVDVAEAVSEADRPDNGRQEGRRDHARRQTRVKGKRSPLFHSQNGTDASAGSEHDDRSGGPELSGSESGVQKKRPLKSLQYDARKCTRK